MLNLNFEFPDTDDFWKERSLALPSICAFHIVASLLLTQPRASWKWKAHGTKLGLVHHTVSVFHQASSERSSIYPVP